MLLKKHLQPKFCEELLLIWLSLDIPESSRISDNLQHYFVYTLFTVLSYEGQISRTKNTILTETTAAECSPLPPGTDKTGVCIASMP